jgi:tetratricopeptide (TPR) repeat protein
MNTVAGNISQEEAQQLQRTVEMFEAITEAQPDDFQSLEILKETYSKLRRTAEAQRTARRLASAYQKQGQISQAILECESILQERPDDPETQELLATMQTAVNMPAAESSAAPSLVKDSKPTPPRGEPTGAPSRASIQQSAAEGDRLLANVLIAEKFATPQAIEPLLAQLQTLRAGGADRSLPLSLIQLIATEQHAKLEDLLTVILDKANLAYLPLGVYDVDRDTACLLPLDLCWQWCVVPFDQISRSVLIATANPFDARARQQIESLIKRSVFWYVSSPHEISTALRRAHGLDGTRPRKGGS